MRFAEATFYVMVMLTLTVLATSRSAAMEIVMMDQAIQLSERTFDQATFGKLAVDSARQKCEESLEAYLELIEKAVVLNDAQRRKLALAGEIDIHRYFADHESVKRTLRFGSVSRNELNALVARLRDEAKPLKTKYEAGLHGDTSLFGKTLVATFDADQMAGLRALENARKKLEYRNYIQVTLAAIDRNLPLTQGQRRGVTELLLEQTKPPKNFGTNMAPVYLVLKRMSQIEIEIRVLFSEKEWGVMKQLVSRGAKVAEIE